MKVRELMAQLYKANPDDLVVVSESDGASPLYSVEEMVYEADSTWFGYLHIRELTDELRAQRYSEEDLCPDGEDCVALWPIN